MHELINTQKHHISHNRIKVQKIGTVLNSKMRHVPIAHSWICPSVSLCINDNNKTANISMHKVHVQSANVHNVQVHIAERQA